MFDAVKFFSLLFSFCLFQNTFAQTSADSISAEKPDSLSVINYFSAKGINLDSCANYALYSEIYQWLGTPYHYGGESRNGIDCSGFSKEVYGAVYHRELKGGSRDIFKTVLPLKEKYLDEGDLLFFKIKKGRISRIGIYLQNGKFAHATTQSGVTISDLTEAYYQKRFYKAGRILGCN